MPLQIKERLAAYTRPLFLLPSVVTSLFTTLRQGTHDLYARTFAHWLTTVGPNFAAYENTTPVATLTPLASGVVVDVGAGCGNQIPRFDRSKIEKVYGVEPNPYLVETLQRRAKDAGLEGVYVPIACGIEDVAQHNILPNTIDSIVCMQTLCSVPSPFHTMAHFHTLLKPGGKLYFWEHTASSDPLTRLVQKFWNPVWKLMVGGCCLDRQLERVILNGEGALWDVKVFEREEGWGLLPRAWGVLVKR